MLEKDYKFRDPLVEDGRFELEAAGKLNDATAIIAYVNGIEIGRSAAIVSPLAERVSIYCGRFPHVNLPVIVRFALGDRGPDACAHLTLSSTSEVKMLVGDGTFTNTFLRVTDGVLQGGAYNAINGVSPPVLMARVNNYVMRNVVCSELRLRDEGGSKFTYHMRLQAEDFQQSGATFEIISLPDLAIISSISYSRNDYVGASAAISATEATVSMLNKRLDFEIARNGKLISELRDEMRLKEDALIEYLTSIALDKDSEEILQNRNFERASSIWGVTKAATRLLIPAASRWFISGWESEIVEEQGVSGRLIFASCGVLLNPHSEKKLARLEFTLFSSLRTCPSIVVLLDAKPVEISVVSSDGHGPYSVFGDVVCPASVTLIRILTSDNDLDEVRNMIADISLIYDVEDAPMAPE